jgi:hypothetical protein
MWRIAGLLYVVVVWWLLSHKPADYLAWLVVASTVVVVLTVEHVGPEVLESLSGLVMRTTSPLWPPR